MSDNVADVQKIPMKIRPETALVVCKGAQQRHNKSGYNEITHAQQRSVAALTHRVLFILVSQLARVVRVHVCYYSLRA